LRQRPRQRHFSLPPIFLGLPCHRWCIRVFHFEPALRSTAAIARTEALADDPLEPELAGVPEHHVAGLGEAHRNLVHLITSFQERINRDGEARVVMNERATLCLPLTP